MSKTPKECTRKSTNFQILIYRFLFSHFLKKQKIKKLKIRQKVAFWNEKTTLSTNQGFSRTIVMSAFQGVSFSKKRQILQNRKNIVLGIFVEWNFVGPLDWTCHSGNIPRPKKLEGVRLE